MGAEREKPHGHAPFASTLALIPEPLRPRGGLGWVAVLAGAAFLASSLFLFVPMSDGPTGAGQQDYQNDVVAAQDDLFTGRLEHTDARSLSLTPGEGTALFSATISGTWTAGTAYEKAAPGNRLPVKAGAQLEVRLHCSGAGVRCRPYGSERKPVVRRSDRAYWSWRVSVKRPGKVKIALTATTYYRDSDSVLAETKPKIINVVVPEPDQSATSRLASAWHWLVGVVTSAAVLAAAVPVFVAAGAAVLTLRRRSSRSPERAPSIRRRNPAGAVRTARYRRRRTEPPRN